MQAPAPKRQSQEVGSARTDGGEQLGSQSLRSRAGHRGQLELLEGFGGPALLHRQLPGIPRQQRSWPEELDPPDGLLPQGQLDQDHVASPVEAVDQPGDGDIPGLDQAGHVARGEGRLDVRAVVIAEHHSRAFHFEHALFGVAVGAVDETQRDFGMRIAD